MACTGCEARRQALRAAFNLALQPVVELWGGTNMKRYSLTQEQSDQHKDDDAGALELAVSLGLDPSKPYRKYIVGGRGLIEFRQLKQDQP